MLALGPSKGILLNTIFYLPMFLWLFWAPPRAAVMVARQAMRGLADIVQTIRSVSTSRVLTSMTLLAGLTSLLVGNAYSAQMPGYADDLGHGDPGLSYSLLLAADAAGALLAGIVLEGLGTVRSTPRSAMLLAALWSLALIGFAMAGSFPIAVTLLFIAGFCELSFNTMAQTLVQLNAPAESRGRVIGLYNMAGLGMRAFSGVSVGLLGAWIGIHWSLGLAALAVLLVLAGLYVFTRHHPVVSGRL